MSLLLMVFVLLGAAAVLGAGVALAAWLTRGPEVEAAPEEEPAETVEPDIGGYSPLPEAHADPPPEAHAGPAPGAEPPPRLPDTTLALVRELLARGRASEAVEVVCDDTGMDPRRAEEAVRRLQSGW
ncbi:hypothetical protein HDA32_005100 [Spinactinospora alkalitolerans]|uniref:Ribosomal protein L7/L12 C-terminal domain-containing protein n=1 Tax=Spinactinospora alkalitolerans TaxID=687207 RepID=A0A852U7S8_9ACTN|nr:hypothetical protein [Spinactinospora alkalitolerans]NYE49980.1 hypothetical protein [Spinactinospora alkalitolerans]